MKLASPAKTAIKRKDFSRPLLDFLNLYWNSIDNNVDIYDYGCGRGDDIENLYNLGFISVRGWDKYCPLPDSLTYITPKDYKEIWRKEGADLVLLIYVLCTIDNNEESDIVLKQAWKLVKPGGTILIATRSSKEIERLATNNNWKEYDIGYITKANTFQMGFSLDDLEEYASSELNNISTITKRIDKTNKYSAVYITKRK